MTPHTTLSRFEYASVELAKDFVRKVYELDSDDDMKEIYETEMKKREANRLYWESPEGKAKEKEDMEKIMKEYSIL